MSGKLRVLRFVAQVIKFSDKGILQEKLEKNMNHISDLFFLIWRGTYRNNVKLQYHFCKVGVDEGVVHGGKPVLGEDNWLSYCF